MRIEIVSHCVNYTRFAMHQVSSLWRHPLAGPHHLTYTLFYAEDDARTRALAEYFSTHERPNHAWNWRPLPGPQVNRRCIGRNMAAKESRANWVWFIDADYCLGPACLDDLARIAEGCSDALIYPRQIRATTHEDGEAMVNAVDSPRLLPFDAEKFGVVQEFSRAIGGVQIARGDVVREIGYVPRRAKRTSERWLNPVEDVTFRKLIGTNGTPVELADVYRIRHRPFDTFEGPPPF
jgi:hypothetical protein